MMSLLSPVQQDGVDYKRIVSYSSVFTEVHLFTNWENNFIETRLFLNYLSGRVVVSKILLIWEYKIFSLLFVNQQGYDNKSYDFQILVGNMYLMVNLVLQIIIFLWRWVRK